MPHFDNFINLLIKVVFRETGGYAANFRLFRAHANAGNVSCQGFMQPPCQFTAVTVSGPAWFITGATPPRGAAETSAHAIRAGPGDGMTASWRQRTIRGEIVLFNKGYEGDLTAVEAWRFLEEDSDAALIDVRTVAEWVYVGLPDIARLGRTVICVQWQAWPQMDINREFVAHLEAEGVTRGVPLLLICRSGHRSRDAAIALTSVGFGPCYNVSDGFEGDLNDAKHRSVRNGWKVAGLPWVQQ